MVRREPLRQMVISDWRSRRKRILERDGGKCIVCGSTAGPIMHHAKPLLDSSEAGSYRQDLQKEMSSSEVQMEVSRRALRLRQIFEKYGIETKGDMEGASPRTVKVLRLLRDVHRSGGRRDKLLEELDRIVLSDEEYLVVRSVWKAANSERNLVILCSSCHKKLHGFTVTDEDKRQKELIQRAVADYLSSIYGRGESAT